MTLTPDIVEQLRRGFPALRREVNGRSAVFLDGPAGTQVPQSVIEAISGYLMRMNANHGGHFATSRDSDAMLAQGHAAVAELLGANDPECVSFGANMTSLTFALSRALSLTWQPGDEVLVTRLEHDANFTPWVLAARDAGARVRYVAIHPDDCTLDLDDLRSKLSERTRLVAVGCASNATGTINPVAEICRWARDLGALTFLDAVHFAPHARIDVARLDCDFLACSAYKFFGPHVGIMWGRRKLLEELEAYKLRPAPNSLPDKWMTGTQNHECIAGTLAAIEYLADVGRMANANANLDNTPALDAAFEAIQSYEGELVAHLLAGLAELPKIRVWGITAPSRLAERLPTVSITHQEMNAENLARHLGNRGIFVWDGNYYALPLTETLGVEPDGMVRIGLVHYNTHEEVDRLLLELESV
ncbi:MAG: cysteine desulfurase-like protein [Pirellulales bacterium]